MYTRSRVTKYISSRYHLDNVRGCATTLEPRNETIGRVKDRKSSILRQLCSKISSTRVYIYLYISIVEGQRFNPFSIRSIKGLDV